MSHQHDLDQRVCSSSHRPVSSTRRRKCYAPRRHERSIRPVSHFRDLHCLSLHDSPSAQTSTPGLERNRTSLGFDTQGLGNLKTSPRRQPGNGPSTFAAFGKNTAVNSWL